MNFWTRLAGITGVPGGTLNVGKRLDALMFDSDVDIRRYLALGKITVTPELPPEQFGSCSVDFRLGHEFNVFEHSRHPYIDLREKKGIEDLMKPVIVADGDAFILQPREFVLAITEETLELSDDVLGRLEGR